MPTLYVAEYAELQKGLGGRVGQLPVEPPLVEQTVAITSSSTQSNPFNAKTQAIRLHADAICSVLIGANPVVTANNGRFAASQTEYRAVPINSGFQVAVITNV